MNRRCPNCRRPDHSQRDLASPFVCPDCGAGLAPSRLWLFCMSACVTAGIVMHILGMRLQVGWRIRARLVAAGGRDIHMWGPFPAWGINARMDRRRYRVSYTDRSGRGREIIVHTRIGIVAEQDSHLL